MQALVMWLTTATTCGLQPLCAPCDPFSGTELYASGGHHARGSRAKPDHSEYSKVPIAGSGLVAHRFGWRAATLPRTNVNIS